MKHRNTPLTVVFVAVIAACFAATCFAPPLTTYSFEPVSMTPTASGDPQFPFEWDYQVNIMTLDPADAPVNDAELQTPLAQAGWLKVIPPEGWIGQQLFPGGFAEWNSQSQDVATYYNTPGSFGGWKVQGQLPTRRQYGSFGLTQNGNTVGSIQQPVLLPAPEPTVTAIMGLGALALIKRR